MDEELLSLLPRRQDRHPDSVPGRRQGLQRAASQRRADVPGAKEPRRPHRAHHLSGPVSRPEAAELHPRPLSALPRLVRLISEVSLMPTEREWKPYYES